MKEIRKSSSQGNFMITVMIVIGVGLTANSFVKRNAAIDNAVIHTGDRNLQGAVPRGMSPSVYGPFSPTDSSRSAYGPLFGSEGAR